MTDYILELRHVWKTYQMGEVEVVALRGVDLQIEHGDFVAIVGPSGSGKSTMMNLVGSLDLPSRGSVLLDGDDIARFSESQLAEIRGQKIGFVFQQFNLIPTMSAFDNVKLPLDFQEVGDDEANDRTRQLLDLVGLSDRIDHLPSQLSGGEMQRVAIARALAVNPEIILADEPTGNLDSKTGEFVMSFFDKIHADEGKTIIIVTHDLQLARHAQKVVQLKDGQIEKITKRGAK